MAKGFNLTAELNLRGPGNLKQIASAIRREIGTVDATVKVKLDKSAERSILNTSNALARLNKELQITAQASAATTTNITGLVGAINSLGGALNGSNSSMSQIVSSAQATTQQMAKLKKGTVEARSEMEEFGRQSALAVRRFAAFNFATGAIFGLLNAVSKATTEFIEFDKQIVRLTQITGESYQQLSRITDTITGLSTGLGVASSDLIKISDTLAQAGFSARETDQALKALALTALAPSFENLNETVEGSIALMRQFKISTEDLDKALGSINAVAAGFAVEASDIITAIQRTGGVFAAASKGVSQGTDALNEFIAVFTSVRATTRESAETIATGLRTIFTRIQREDTIDALKEYGVNLLDVEGKFVGAYKAVKLLSEGLGKLDPRDTSFSRIVEELGGFRQIGKVLPLIQEFATAQQALGVAQRGQSSLALDAVKAQSSLAVQFSKTRESFVALIRDIGNSDSFKTLVSLGLTLANTFIKVADVAKPLLPIITAIGAIKGAKALTSYVGGFVGGLRKVKPSSGGPAAGGADQAAAARSQQIADSYTDNSTALNNTTSALNNLTTAISPLTASIDNLGNGVMTQLLNEITSLNNNLSSLPPSGPTLNRGGVVRKFAKGGPVPGSGNTDNVPALLTPGEFVVNKKAAKAVGSKNLHRINGYADGGSVKAGIASIEDIQVSDGDTFDAMVTPKEEPFKAKFRVWNYDAYENKNKDSRVSAKKYKTIKDLPGNESIEEERSTGGYKIPASARVDPSSRLTAAGAADQGTSELSAFLNIKKQNQKALVESINQNLGADGGFGRYKIDFGKNTEVLEDRLTTGRYETKNLGGIIQKFEKGGVAQRKVGYIDYDVIANEANKDIVEKGMKETGSDGPRIYSDYLTKLAVNARKSANIQKLRAIYGVAGSGKTTLARGQGTDSAKLRQTERFPILSPEDIDRATEILILTSSVSKTKMDDFFGDVDRAYTLSSTTDAERQDVKNRKTSRDITGIGLENRQPGTTMGVSTDSAVGEALLSDKLGSKSTVLGRSGSGRLRRKKGNELVEIIKKRIGFTWGGFAPTTAGHESIMDAAAAMGIPPEDFIALVGANEAVDPSSYRTAVFDQDARVLLAKAGFGAKGATVLPKPRDFEVPQGFDITQQGSDRRKVLIPDKGSTAFVADKTEDQTAKYKQAGYGVQNIERTGDISGTMVRDLIISGDMAKLQSVLSPGVYDLISNNIGRIQNRASVLPSLIEQAQKEAQAEMSHIDKEIEALGIKRIDSKKMEEDPEYAAKVEVLKELRTKKQKMKSAAGFTPYKLLDALAQKDPQNYALDFSAPATMGNVPAMRVMGQNSQAPEAPMPVGRVAQLAQEKNKSIQDVILEQLGGLGGPAGVKKILGIGSGDRTLSSLLQAGNIKSGKGLEEAADYVNKALAAKGIKDAAEAKRLEEYQAKATHFGIAGLLPIDYSKEFEWNIDGTDVYATARGFGSMYLEEARQMQKESSALAQKFAENVQNKNIFGGGEKLAFDFDKTLVEDADILDAKGNPDIQQYSNRDAVKKALQNARPTRLAAKLKSLIEQDPPFIKKTRILTARPQSTADLLAQSLQSFGLPYAATDITGVSGGPSSNIAALKAANLQQEEKLIDDNLDNIRAAHKAGKKGFQYVEPKSTTSELDEKMGQGNIEGAIVEKALAVLGAPVRPDAKQNRAIDYPDGLGSAAQFFPGIDPGIPTEVKRTIDGTSLEKVREEIGSYLTGGAEAVKLALGGIVQKFAVGGVAEPEEKKKEKQYGYTGLYSDNNSISAMYLGNKNRTGNASAYKFRDNLYYMGMSSATGGYGPRLYDLVMEAATEKGAMLTSDRNVVSGAAKKVWEYYFNNRADVKKTPLDPKDWTMNKAMIDPALQGDKSTWPPATDPAWVLQTGYSKSPSLIKDPSVKRLSKEQKSTMDHMAVSNFMSSKIGSPEKFASGGIVPGTGNRDTVPASLTPGDFVIRKSSVAKLGLGGSQGFASGGEVPALLTPGELVVPQAQAKKIGYGKLNTMNKYGRYNKGGAVGIQKFEMGGEILTPQEMSTFRSSMANVMATFSDEVSSTLDKITLPTIDTSSWEGMRKSLVEIGKVVRHSFDTLGPEVTASMNAMLSAGNKALAGIETDRARTRQSEIASDRGYSSADIERMKEDTSNASSGRSATFDRKRKNTEREAQGKAPFPVLDLMEMMRSSVGRKPDPISVSASTPTAPVEPPRDAEFYTRRMNYSDVSGKDTIISGRGMQYAEELAKQDPGQVDALVKQLRDMFSTVMADVKTPSGQISPAGQSQSWANWDIGKQLFMSKNPDQSSDKYHLGNPMQDPKVMLQMVQRMVGYEATGGGKRNGVANNIPSFELVEIGAKAMAESLSKNEAALDAFVKTLNGITREDIIGSTTASSTASTPTPPMGGGLGYPGSMPTAPTIPPSPIAPSPPTPPIVPPTSPPAPPAPPGPPKPPLSGDAEAAVQRYMMEMEAAAKAVKIQTYQEQRLAGATATEAKARADAAAQAAAQAVAQQRLAGATAEETVAIADAITRINKVKGGVTLSRDDMNLPAQALARGGAPAPDNTDYAAATKANVDSINSMTESFTKFSFGLAASEGLGEFIGLIGSDSALGKTVNNLVSSLTSTSALFIAANAAVSTFTSVLSSETTADYLNSFSDYLTSASRKVEDFSAGFSGSAAKGVLDRIASGLGSGSGMISKLAGNLPQIASGLSGALSSLAGPVGMAITGVNLLASTFISVTDSIRQAALDEAIKDFDDNLKYAEQSLNSYSRNTIDNANQLDFANAAILNMAKAAKTQADMSSTNPQWGMTNIIGESLALGGRGSEDRGQRGDILDKKGMGAYIVSLLDMSGRTQTEYTKDLAPQKALETAEKFKKPAELQQKVFEERFKKGESSVDIMKSSDWEQQTEILARSNAAIEEQIRLIDADLSVSKAARDTKKQEIMSIAAANSVREQEVRYIKNKNAEDASDASSKLLYGLDRMLSNMEQSINTVTHSLDKLADQTDLFKSSMTGEAKIGGTRLDASNILKNPNIYTKDERSKAAGVGADFFGPQSQDIKGLLQFGPDLENTLMSTINRTIKEDPGASSGKIEARITQNVEKQLSNLNIDEGLKQVLSKDIGSTISASRQSGEDKRGFDEVFSKTSSLGKTIDAANKAQEAALKALEFYQQSVNNYAQSMNEAVALQMSSNEKMRRADDIRVRGEMTLAKTLGKNISLENTTSAARAGVTSQAGTSDPRQIMNNIGRLEMTRQNQQASVDASAQKGSKGSKDLMAFTSQLSGTTMQLRDNYAALKSLSESTEVADAALSKIGELKAKNEAGLGILERFVSSTPKEQAKLSQSFERLDRNMNGQANSMWDSTRVQEAYNEALKNGGSMQDAQEAADQAAAQDRGDTMEAFKMLAPYLGDNQNDLKANMLESMMTESGVEMSPMFNQVLEGLRNPESDPQMAEAINQYRQATELQTQANKYLAQLDGGLAQQIGTQAQLAFTNALTGVQQANANANAKDMVTGINNLYNHMKGGVTKVTTVSSGTKETPDIPGMAKGGVVEYRAVGGSIFKPKGSDTVPAMLTPGEFVVNKSAASSNGPLLHAINNGYSKGGSVKYYSEGGWVSGGLKDIDAGRFKDASPNTLYTKYDDFSKLGQGDISQNLDLLKETANPIQYVKPHSVPTFNGTSDKLYTSSGYPIPEAISSKMSGAMLGVLPDFTLSRGVLSAAATGGIKGAATGAAIRAGAGGSAVAAAGAATSNATGTVDGAPLGIGGDLGGYVWEAMKYVPYLGAAISGIDAVRELMKGNLGAAAIEGLGAVLNLIPLPGASFIGKPLTGALSFLLKKMPFLKTFGTKIGEYIPAIFKTIAPGIYEPMQKFFGKKTQDIVLDLIPSSWKKKLVGMLSKGSAPQIGPMTSGAATAAETAFGKGASSVVPTLTRNAIPGMAAIGGGTAAVQAVSAGARPIAQNTIQDKLKDYMVTSNFKYPKLWTQPKKLSKDLNSNLDVLTLEEAQQQLVAIAPWINALKEGSSWKHVTKAEKNDTDIKIKSPTVGYSTYSYGKSSPSGDNEFMFADVSNAGAGLNLPQNAKLPTTGMLQFTPGGYPTLGSDEESSNTNRFYGESGVSFDPSSAAEGEGIQDFKVLYDYLQDYYNSLINVKPLDTNQKDFNPKFWTKDAPAKRTENKRASILKALATGERVSYDFDESELKDLSLYSWPGSAATSAETTNAASEQKKSSAGRKLTVFSKAIRSSWKQITDNDSAKEAVTNKQIWGGDASTAFTVENPTSNTVVPLPWTTDLSLIGNEAIQMAQKTVDDTLAKKTQLEIGTARSYSKEIDLPKSKGKLPVFFNYKSFTKIPLMPENDEFPDDPAKISFLTDGKNTAKGGLFVTDRTTQRSSGSVNPFQTLNKQSNAELPYYSADTALDEAVTKWAQNNFDLTDFSLAGINLAANYSPIIAERAFKPSDSIRSTRTSRKDKKTSPSPQDSEIPKFLLNSGALFYDNDYKVGEGEIAYRDAQPIIISQLPAITEAMQTAGIRAITMSKDERRKKIQQEASSISFKKEHIPLLGGAVWSKIKYEDLPVTEGLKTANDWLKAASDDGMSPPEEIKTQTDLLDAVDYLSWVKSKVLQVTQKARGISQEKLEEVQNLNSEAAFGKYMSAGRFLSQLSAQEDGGTGSSGTISQASERLYSRYIGKIDQWTTKERIGTARGPTAGTQKSSDKAAGKGFEVGDEKPAAESRFWDVPKILSEDTTFTSDLLKFAAQQRGAQKFDQLITGNKNAKLSDIQTNSIKDMYNKYAGPDKTATDDKNGVKQKMKALEGGQLVDLEMPTDISGVKAQFMDDNKVYEPKYRDLLGNTLMQLGDKYSAKWSKSGDPGTSTWSETWSKYSAKLEALRDFLVYRDELLIRPIAKEGNNTLYTPAVLPGIKNGLIPTIKDKLMEKGIPVPEISEEMAINAIKNPASFAGFIGNIFNGATASIPPENYEKIDELDKVKAAVDSFYANNFSPTALPRVYTEEGNNLWKEISSLYPNANEAFSMFSGGVSGEGTGGSISDATVQLKALDDIYNENIMVSGQPNSLYNLYYNQNKKAGISGSINGGNSITAMQTNQQAAAPKPETKTATTAPTPGSVAAQAVANSGSQEVGTPPIPNEEETKKIVGPGAAPQEPLAKAKGGLIYRASGGPAPVNWTPRGTDSVPAMLTPGEYVINRSSTQKYLPILEAINNGNSSQGAIAAAVQAGGVPATSYASRGGVISPRYFSRGAEVGAASGVSNSYSMGFDSATLAAIKQFDTSVKAFGEALSQLSIGNIKLDEAALSALGDFATKFDQFTQSLLKLNVPPVISITGQHEVNVNLNGAAIFSTMEESMQHMIVNEINKAFGQLSKDNEGGIAMNYRPGPPTA